MAMTGNKPKVLVAGLGTKELLLPTPKGDVDNGERGNRKVKGKEVNIVDVFPCSCRA